MGPCFGRFYPGRFLGNPSNHGPHNRFRCVGDSPTGIEADLNHPLSESELVLEAAIGSVLENRDQRGGTMRDCMELLADGPGMQARWQGRPTDFMGHSGAFARADEGDDSVFYEKPRLVTHVDDQALEHISSLYGRLLSPGMSVLDLMSSWKSHLPEDLPLSGVTGLGLNREELEKNTRLTGHMVHDLNADPRLPFADGMFDAVVCTVSVEYMMRPVEVFTDVARVLKPDGRFILTFSHRWFPPKVIALWEDLHPFERVGLVLEYFLLSKRFSHLNTLSVRGWPRPVTDRYYPGIRTSDPVFAVWGRAR
jgi:SAM-dependent methyltransferase